MRDLSVILVLFFLISGCNSNPESVPEQNVPVEVSKQNLDLPGLTTLSGEVQSALKDWMEFSELEESILKLGRVENYEDYVLLTDELVEKMNALKVSTFPSDFDDAQIRSRLKVVETYILKLQSDLHYRQPTEEASRSIFEAYNAFRTQFNVIVNSKIDSKLIFDE